MLGFIICEIIAVISSKYRILTIHNNMIDFDDKRKAKYQTSGRIERRQVMLRKVTLVVLLIAGTIATLLGCRPAQTRIVVGTDPTFPPMESRDANGNIVGIDIDIMNEIGKAEKMTIEYQNIPWDAIFSSVQQGSVDAIISSITILDWRKMSMDFSLPYISTPQVIVVKKGTTGIETTKDLYNKRVGVLKGSKTIRQMQEQNIGC